jgi:hypothetical protein
MNGGSELAKIAAVAGFMALLAAFSNQWFVVLAFAILALLYLRGVGWLKDDGP